LIIFRIAQGAAAALMYPQVISFIQVSFDQSERPRAFGYYAAIAGLASILGQVFGGFLLTANLFNTGWRSIFLVNVPIGIVVLPAALLLLRESKMPEAHRLDYGGVSLLTLTLFLLVFPLVLGEGAGWSWWMLIGLLDVFFTASSGNPLRAFVISILVIVLLSLGLSLSVLPLAGSHPLTTESEAFMHEQKEETERVHQREKRG
jgi:MFS family permease